MPEGQHSLATPGQVLVRDASPPFAAQISGADAEVPRIDWQPAELSVDPRTPPEPAVAAGAEVEVVVAAAAPGTVMQVLKI